MFYDQYTNIAIIAALMGCLIRYTVLHKQHDATVKLIYFVSDMITSGFLGYLAYWYIVQEGVATPVQGTIASCVIGNLGSRVFDYISYILHSKFKGINFKYESSSNDKEK